ncbi:hypothetical protein B0H11DRAFT_1922105 [Mycena galericulata]|nr:hypothetical protein B0H11DRAFT_1922105 [Mycena galericulata]
MQKKKKKRPKERTLQALLWQRVLMIFKIRLHAGGKTKPGQYVCISSDILDGQALHIKDDNGKFLALLFAIPEEYRQRLDDAIQHIHTCPATSPGTPDTVKRGTGAPDTHPDNVRKDHKGRTNFDQRYVHNTSKEMKDMEQYAILAEAYSDFFELLRVALKKFLPKEYDELSIFVEHLPLDASSPCYPFGGIRKTSVQCRAGGEEWGTVEVEMGLGGCPGRDQASCKAGLNHGRCILHTRSQRRVLSMHKALYLLGVIISLYPLLRLHLNQRRQPRQRTRTAWLKSILVLLRAGFKEDDAHPPTWASGIGRSDEYAEYICRDLGPLYMMLGLDPDNLQAPSPPPPFPTPRPVLCTARLSCVFCPVVDLHVIPTLRRREKSQTIWLLDNTFHWVEADLLVAHCASCRADYYPDCITFRDEENGRRQRLEITPQYIRVSKHGIWVDRKIAVFQEKALDRFHAGWSNFADWLNESTGSKKKLTYRQSQRLFIEHFSRRLLLFHGKHDDFNCTAHPSTRVLSEAVRAAIGANGGAVPAAMTHGCAECTHLKRYHSDLVNEGAVLGTDIDVAGMPLHGIGDEVCSVWYSLIIHVANLSQQEAVPGPADPAIAQLFAPHQQEAPPNGEPRGYIRLAVMDGKTIKHRHQTQKCALDMCDSPLVNYKDGRFCEAHLNLRDVCGIIPCGRPVRHAGAVTCDAQSHIDWHRQYEGRFSRLSFPGVRRVIRRQQGLADANDANAATGPTLRVDLSALGKTPGDQVVHTFKAKTTYCLQTVQWASSYVTSSPRTRTVHGLPPRNLL